MDSGTVIDLGRDSLVLAVMLAGPLLAIALLVGIVIGVIQAATSINEMTLSFIPKLGALVLVLALVGSWQIGVLVDFTTRLYMQIPGFFE